MDEELILAAAEAFVDPSDVVVFMWIAAALEQIYLLSSHSLFVTTKRLFCDAAPTASKRCGWICAQGAHHFIISRYDGRRYVGIVPLRCP